jgi:hypothetical protein
MPLPALLPKMRCQGSLDNFVALEADVAEVQRDLRARLLAWKASWLANSPRVC